MKKTPAAKPKPAAKIKGKRGDLPAAFLPGPTDLARMEAMASAARARDAALLARIKAALPELDALRTRRFVFDDEEGFYRFYHHSFKVYSLQPGTEQMVAVLAKLAPDGAELNEWFRAIIADGTGRVWERSHNQEWLKHTRPIVEAHSHARYFVAMACKYGRELEAAPQSLPYGWAALLELYGIR